jgi:predicted CXXCH cytochrome family protein
VFDSCSNCHDPHGSVNERLLKYRAPRLCNQCHNSTHGTRNGPNSYYSFNRSCTNCHSQIHGSNHPSGVFFQR